MILEVNLIKCFNCNSDARLQPYYVAPDDILGEHMSRDQSILDPKTGKKIQGILGSYRVECECGCSTTDCNSKEVAQLLWNHCNQQKKGK